MSWRPKIITTDHNGQDHRIDDDFGRQWFTHYGADGSGFGYLSFRLRRRVGYNYRDIGYAFPVVMMKGPFRVLFSGQIVRTIERTTNQGDEIEVWALGWVHVAENDVYNWIYCDTRLIEWIGSEEASGSFHPEWFDWATDNRIYFKPRRNVDIDADAYTYLRYTFHFGEVATRITADFDVEFPGGYPGGVKLEVRDSNGTVLWSTTSDEAGSIDEITTGSPTYFEVRFYNTIAGEVTADDDTVYGELTNVKVYSVDVDTLDASVVAEDIVALLSDVGHGLSSSTAEISAPGRVLEPCVFDRDMTAAQVMRWCVQFGDSNGAPLAWGVTFDNRKRLFLETADKTKVLYVLKARPQRATLERSGDWNEGGQKAYGIYFDEQGIIHRTDDHERQDAIDDLGGHFRRVAIQVPGTTDEDRVIEAVDLWLDEHDAPPTAGSFSVSEAWTPTGVPVPFDELIPTGGLVQIREWRAVEATLSHSDYRDKTTTFPLAGIRVDEDSRLVELIPRETSDAFARQMAIIQELLS